MIKQRLLLLLLSLLPLTAMAENSTKIPGFTIHHNAIPTAMISPDVARQYQIVRSKYRGMLNVSIIKDLADTIGKAVTADVQAHTFNLIGQIHNIKLQEIREGEAIYYIGDFPIVDGETLKIRMEIIPEGLSRTTKAEISQQFFID